MIGFPGDLASLSVVVVFFCHVFLIVCMCVRYTSTIFENIFCQAASAHGQMIAEARLMYTISITIFFIIVHTRIHEVGVCGFVDGHWATGYNNWIPDDHFLLIIVKVSLLYIISRVHGDNFRHFNILMISTALLTILDVCLATVRPYQCTTAFEKIVQNPYLRPILDS